MNRRNLLLTQLSAAPVVRLYAYAVVVYVALWALCGFFEEPDTPSYLEPAIGMVTHFTYGGQLSTGEWVPIAFRPPGLPTIMGVWYFVSRDEGTALLLTTLTNALLAPLVPIAAYMLGSLLSPLTGYLAYFFLLLHANVLYLTVTAMADLPFAAVLAGSLMSLWTALRERTWLRFAVSGLLLGFAILIKPVALLYPVVLAGLAILLPRRLWPEKKQVGLVLLCMAIVIAPWIVRNTVRYGRPVFHTLGGQAAIWAMVKYVQPKPEDTAETKLIKNYIAQTDYAPGFTIFYRGRDYWLTHDLLVSDRLSGIGKEVCRDNFELFLKTWWHNAVNMTFTQMHYDVLYDDILTRTQYQRLRHFLVKLVPSWDRKFYHLHLEGYRIARLSYFYAIWAGLVLLLITRRWKIAAFVILTCAYFTAVTAMVSGYDRFRLCIDPCYAVLACYPVSFLVSFAVRTGSRVYRRTGQDAGRP
jgi:4-amino-4-deoxy-L-arabinose transferase-like glycosyltransferase